MNTITVEARHGAVEGVYARAVNSGAPLAVISNGHNGFYAYGMFPHIQAVLQDRGISSFSYNYSHGGTVGDADYFTELDAYEKNCMRLETLDLLAVVEGLSDSEIDFDIDGDSKTPLYLMSHSLGVIPTVFASRRLQHHRNLVAGIILLSPISTLDIFPPAMIDVWKENDVFPLINNRTRQDLPQGAEFLSEILSCDTAWNVQIAMSEIETRYLIIHGAEDSDVGEPHSAALRGWAIEAGCDARLHLIENAGHTFNTRHPFEGTSPELEKALKIVTDWIAKS